MTDDSPSSGENPLAPTDISRTDSAPTISSQELLQGRREVWIDHDGQVYRLRLTSRGKLYLTK